MDKNQFSYIIKEVDNNLKTIKSLKTTDSDDLYSELKSLIKDFKDGGEKLLKDGDILQIGIVGQVKAGKSSFLNSLFFDGESILPKASTPMTAGLTVLEYSDENSFEVEYFSREDWSVFVDQDESYKRIEQEIRQHEAGAPASVINRMIEERTSEGQRSAHEMVSACSASANAKIGANPDKRHFNDKNDLQDILEKYVGANGEYTSVVKNLFIKMNDKRLKGMRIVDTPGVNDPVISRENRTRMFLHSCHGVFLLSSATDFLGSGDVNFLNNRIGNQGIGCVLLLASKFDSMLQDIGAECEMKQKDRQDLVEVKDTQLRRLKRRLNEQRDTIVDNLKIKVDFTSGIGYSIAHKDKSKWDEVERNVVNQMTRFYPDYFCNDADVRETFEALSNISDIRKNYLEGWFLSNKEEIISNKINDYFAQNQVSISEFINKKDDELERKLQILKETNKAQIQQQRKTQSKIFDSLENKFKYILKKFANDLQNNMKNIFNSVDRPILSQIPIEQTSGYIEHKGMLWGHNSTNFNYDIINTHQLEEELRSLIKGYAKEVNDKWENLLNEARKETEEMLSDEISNFELTLGASSSFDDKYYRSLIESTIDDMRIYQAIDIDTIISDANDAIARICDKNYTPGDSAKDSKESKVPGILKEGFEDHLKVVKSGVRTFFDSHCGQIKNQINDNMKATIAQAENLKNDFTPRLREEGEKYMADLESKLQNKKEAELQLQLVVSSVKKIKNLFN